MKVWYLPEQINGRRKCTQKLSGGMVAKKKPTNSQLDLRVIRNGSGELGQTITII